MLFLVFVFLKEDYRVVIGLAEKSGTTDSKTYINKLNAAKIKEEVLKNSEGFNARDKLCKAEKELKELVNNRDKNQEKYNKKNDDKELLEDMILVAVNDAMKNYRELVRPAFDASDRLMRNDNSLYDDTNAFTKLIEKMKMSLSATHVDFSV